jgi:hypothetical protein
MRRTEQLQGLRMLKLRETLTRWESGRLSQLEAAEILGMSERTFRRWARRFEADGQTGLTDTACPARRARGAVRMGKGSHAIIPRPLQRPDRETLSRISDARAWFPLALQLDEEFLAKRRPDRASPPARGAPAQTRPAPDGGHDAASGRVDARLAARPRCAGPGGDDGRRHKRDLFGDPGGGRRHDVELSGIGGDDRGEGIVQFVPYV